jgi:tRNA G10  N-methylase Trm11
VNKSFEKYVKTKGIEKWKLFSSCESFIHGINFLTLTKVEIFHQKKKVEIYLCNLHILLGSQIYNIETHASFDFVFVYTLR